MAPVVKALQETPSAFEPVICATAQHRHMLDQVLSVFDVSPDIDLDLMESNQTLPSLTSKSLLRLTEVIRRVKPQVTLVQGDTTTAFVAGLASFYEKIPVGHVEAGLRTSCTYDPFPEEMNRRLLTQLSSYHFAPTASAVDALKAEGVDQNRIALTGNTGIDALLTIASRDNLPDTSLPLKGTHLILVTAHRRENFGHRIRDICEGLKQIVRRNPRVDLVFPVHPNPNISEPVRSMLSDIPQIHLISPLEYEAFVGMMQRSHLILTDSGGIQEEAPSLGKPVLVMRETTERREAVDAGVARLVGTRPESIVAATEELLHDKDAYSLMAQVANPFGDGHAATRIVEFLATWTLL